MSNWHPWSQLNSKKITLDAGDGIYLFDDLGTKYIDAKSGCLNSILGYGNDRIAGAILNCIERLHNVDFQTFSHQAANNYSKRILESVGLPELEYCFYTSGGSEAVEMALKTIIDYRIINNQKDKKYIISIDKGYHGSTFLTSALSGLPQMKNCFFEKHSFVHHLRISSLKNDFQVFAEEVGYSKISAFVFEPVLGVGGYVFPNKNELEWVLKECKTHNIMLIADETFTGFGRLGSMTASEEYKTSPDILILGKGITAGYFPFAVTLVGKDIHDTFKNDKYLQGLRYGHTNSGHIIGTTIANEVLDILYEENLFENAKRIGRYIYNKVFNKLGSKITNYRYRGALIAFDCIQNSQELENCLYNNNLLLKCQGNCFAIIPPLNITLQEADEIVERLFCSLDEFYSR